MKARKDVVRDLFRCCGVVFFRFELWDRKFENEVSETSKLIRGFENFNVRGEFLLLLELVSRAEYKDPLETTDYGGRSL